MFVQKCLVVIDLMASDFSKKYVSLNFLKFLVYFYYNTVLVLPCMCRSTTDVHMQSQTQTPSPLPSPQHPYGHPRHTFKHAVTSPSDIDW